MFLDVPLWDKLDYCEEIISYHRYSAQLGSDYGNIRVIPVSFRAGHVCRQTDSSGPPLVGVIGHSVAGWAVDPEFCNSPRPVSSNSASPGSYYDRN